VLLKTIRNNCQNAGLLILTSSTDSIEEAAEMEFRADLILVLQEFFREQAASQAQVGQILGIPNRGPASS
jgi:predicted XRE-type DNA-binding protein